MKWDFGPNDEITYFDPECSYWLTKYRPITKDKGLDFNPDWFREDAINKLSTGKYSTFQEGSKSHRSFWEERMRRSIEGYEVNGYRITGDNYFWLNYYRLKQNDIKSKASSGRKLSFPVFLVYQYEYFHYLEMCEILKKDVGLVKSRGCGFSEIAAELCIRPFITTPNYRVVASAFSERHLKPLLTKAWSQLSWLSAETETAFRRVCMVVNTNMHKRASKKNKDGTEAHDSHMSEVEGVIADDTEKIRGDRTERLLFEEAGSDKLFKKKWIQGEALVNVMGQKVGTRIGWGTGGGVGASIEGIRDMVFSPTSWDILPYKHNHTPDNRFIMTAMFIPAYRTVLELIDSRGWCDPELGKEYYEKIRLRKLDDPKGLMLYKAEYCFTIEEALIGQGDNLFPKEQLAEQLANLTIYKSLPIPTTGHLIWTVDSQDNKTGVKWKQSEEGKILILEHPRLSEDGHPYKNLYVAGIDSIDIGSADSAAGKGSSESNALSDYCVVIKRRVFGQTEPQYVAIYKDRPGDPREAYEITAKLLTYYSCQAVLEATRTAILTYYRDRKYLHLLMKRPRATMPNVTKGNPNMFGAPTGLKTITHYRELIYDFVLDYYYTMGFVEMVEQLLNYSDEKKRMFDIVAAMGMAELGDEELSFKKPEEINPKGKQFQDIGWFKDSNGYKHFGAIPKNSNERYEKNRPRVSDQWLYNELI